MSENNKKYGEAWRAELMKWRKSEIIDFLKDTLVCNRIHQWHRQSEYDIYDCVNDWDIHYFVCIMKNEHRVFATGICDEDYDGNVSQNLFFDDCDEKYNCDEIKWWQEIELPKE